MDYLLSRKKVRTRVVGVPLALLCLTATLRAQEATSALSLLKETAHKYQTLGSYEYSATAERPLDGGYIGKAHISFGYASPKFTPADLPVPSLDSGMVGVSGIYDREGKPAPPDYVKFHGSFPLVIGPPIALTEINWRVVDATITGSEAVQSHECRIVAVRYEVTRRTPGGNLVRYWIDPQTYLIWKVQFSQLDPLSKTTRLARWTMTWDTWIENQPPSDWLIEAGKKQGAEQRTVLTGRAAPEIEGYSLAGKPFQLSALKGSVVVLDFWGTWCGPCSEEMNTLESLKSSLAGKPVEIWSVTQDKPDTARRWIAERGHTLPTAVVPKDTAFKAYKIDAIPQLVIINPKGEVAHQRFGLKKDADLLAAVNQLIQ